VLACTKHTMAIKCSTDSTSYQGSAMDVSSAISSWLAHTNCTLFLSSLPSFASPIRVGKYSSRAWRRLAVLDPPENQRLLSKQKILVFTFSRNKLDRFQMLQRPDSPCRVATLRLGFRAVADSCVAITTTLSLRAVSLSTTLLSR